MAHTDLITGAAQPPIIEISFHRPSPPAFVIRHPTFIPIRILLLRLSQGHIGVFSAHKITAQRNECDFERRRKGADGVKRTLLRRVAWMFPLTFSHQARACPFRSAKELRLIPAMKLSRTNCILRSTFRPRTPAAAPRTASPSAGPCSTSSPALCSSGPSVCRFEYPSFRFRPLFPGSFCLVWESVLFRLLFHKTTFFFGVFLHFITGADTVEDHCLISAMALNIKRMIKHME